MIFGAPQYRDNSTSYASASICPRNKDWLYPAHDWNETEGSDAANYSCSKCGLRALDIDVDGIQLVTCEHGEEPDYCDCGFTGGQVR